MLVFQQVAKNCKQRKSSLQKNCLPECSDFKSSKNFHNEEKGRLNHKIHVSGDNMIVRVLKSQKTDLFFLSVILNFLLGK